MHKMEQVILLDFGGTYTQLLARRIRDARVYCEVLPCTTPLADVLAKQPKGLILCGPDHSISAPDALLPDAALLNCAVPVLAVGYCFAAMVRHLGGKVSATDAALTDITVVTEQGSALLEGCPASFTLKVRAADRVDTLPQGFVPAAQGEVGIIAAENKGDRRYGVLAHQAMAEGGESLAIFRNFLYQVCGCAGDWRMDTFIDACIADIRAQVGEQGSVLLGLSGGVDSSVCAALIYKAIGKRLHCVFVNHGFMRKGEPEQVQQVFTQTFPVHLVAIDAVNRFQAQVDDITDPEVKRKQIGAEFISVFAEEAAKLGAIDYLAQGTIYPDIIESGVTPGSKVIKSHHNVGGLPKDLKFKGLVEPLKYLFKDEVRRVGEALGLPADMVWRQPFPGPGLAVRVIGAITQEKLRLVREADAIVREEIAAAGLDKGINQYFALLTGVQSVGIRNDDRCYEYAACIRAVVTEDFMSADWARIPHDVLARMSARITREVVGINRVVYDITTKPPASVEWE